MTTSVKDKQTVYFSHSISIGFDETNPIVNNKYLQLMLSEMPDDVKVKDGQMTAIMLDTHDLGYFMHMLYCASENNVISLIPDGIHAFEAKDDTGEMKQFNGQMFYLSEKSE